nr:diaminopimelate decarboxylase [Candidatus Gracilibacteria bacterium]
MVKQSILTLEQARGLDINNHPTPFVVYEQKGIEANMGRFYKAFDWVLNFQNYFAVKACPNPTILRILKNLGSGADCSSMGELVMSEICGLEGENIMFTSNNTHAAEFIKAHSMGAIINFDDIIHIPFYERQVGEMPEIACCRFNPGELKRGNDIIGKPTNAKYGMTREQIFEAYKMLRDKGVKRFGLHTMVASNELNPDYFIETAKILFELVKELEEKLGIIFEFVNLGGGIGIPYKPEQKEVDLERVSEGIRKEYKELIGETREKAIRIVMECGRMITGPYGQLVTKVQHVTEKYKNYVGVDASMQCLMRPALYGAYHHISVLGKENEPANQIYDVTGSLCENNDKFAIDRQLPEVKKGDYLVIHDAGAHGTAMGFNYNAKLRPAELLKTTDGEIKLIRRAENLQDYFSTVNGIDGFSI